MILMVLESFRTYDRLDLVFGVENLYKLTYHIGAIRKWGGFQAATESSQSLCRKEKELEGVGARSEIVRAYGARRRINTC